MRGHVKPAVRLPLILWAALGLVVAAFFRLVHLGYSDFQGDEARAMLMAWRLVEGRDADIIFWHKKGPIEILVPAVAMLAGLRDEFAARLPFALAGLATVAAVAAFGARRFCGPLALAVIWLMAVDGYLIAFSRIVQYQSFVLVTGALAVLAATRATPAASAAAGILVGLGTWGHYEAVFALPPVIWLLVGDAGARRRGVLLAALAVTGAVFVAGLFYVPFALHSAFGETFSYIAERRVGTGLLYDNLGDFAHRASFYNSAHYVAALGLFVSTALCVGLYQAWGRRGLGLALGLLAAATVATLTPGGVTVGGRPITGLFVAPLLAAAAVAPGLPVAWRAAVVWFAGPFLAAAFLVTKPHTHFYTMVPGAMLLAAWVLEGALRRMPPARRQVALAGVAGLWCVFAVHQYVVFIRHEPEYKRVYPEARLPGYWTPYGDELPRGGYFGFPYSAGWNVVGNWFAAGELAGDYDSNEELLITAWYTHGAPRCDASPRYLIEAWRPQDVAPLADPVAAGYHLWGVVEVEGKPKLQVYDREPVVGPVRRVEARVPRPVLRPPPWPPAVAQGLGLPVTAQPGGHIFSSDHEANAAAGGSVALLVGWDATLSDADQGSRGFTLAWQALGQSTRPWSVFVHLVGPDGETLSQSDGWPGCQGRSTSGWEVGETVVDPHVVKLPAGSPPGTYRVIAGLYDPESGRRALTDGTGQDHVELAAFEVAP